MMQAFRNAAKPVVYLITITFLGWMVFSLSGLSGEGGGILTKTSVGSINGKSIDSRVYQQAVQNAITQRQQGTGNSLTLEETEQVRNEVWDSFIQSVVLGEQIRLHRISVSDDEITDWIRNVPPAQIRTLADFQTNGQFDMTKYQRWLASPVGQGYVPQLEAQSRDEMLRNKLFVSVTADIYLSDAALWQRYRDQHEQVKISLTPIIGRNIVADSQVTVSPAEIDAYYKAHPKEFSRPRTAFMSFVAVPRRLDASDTAAALARAQSVRQELIGGAKFEDLAKRESADTASAGKGGSLGTIGKGQTDPVFEKAAMALPVNTVSQPVLTAMGYHLIEVTRKTKDSITVRQIMIPLELAGAHRDLVDAEADSLQRLGAARLDPAALDTVARALKRPIGKTDPVQEGTRVLLGPYVVPDAGVWAFQAKVGETSEVIEGEAAFYVFRLDSIQEAGTPPVGQISDVVARMVREEKKDERAKEIAAELVKRVNAGTSLPEASKQLHLINKEFGPFTRISPPLTATKLVGAAFGIPRGEHSGVIDTPDGLYVIHILDHINADSADFEKNKDTIRNEMIRAMRDQRVRDYLTAIRQSARIKDRRNSMRQTNAQAEQAQARQAGNPTGN